jgi:hypothetical protein
MVWEFMVWEDIVWGAVPLRKIYPCQYGVWEDIV